MGFAPYRPCLVCLTHERTPAILVALTAIAITPRRRLAIAVDPATSRPADTRVATCAAPAPPRARHPLHLVLPRGPRCSSGNSREMVR